MPELAYRHPSQRGKAHRWDGWRNTTGLKVSACAPGLLLGWVGDPWSVVFVDQVDPGDLCKRCWPGRTEQ